MAGGFNATPFATGLLGNWTDQINDAKDRAAKEQDYGDKAQFDTFEQAAKEYDKEKADQSSNKDKIDAIAKTLSSTTGHAIGPWAYATARDAVNMGWDKPEHLPYLISAGNLTYQDQVNNPDRWNVPVPKPTVYDRDSDPRMTAIMQKFGDNRSLQEAEAIRNHAVPKNYDNLPGTNFSGYNDVRNQQASDKATATVDARNDANMSSFGYPSGTLNQSPTAQQQPQQAPNPTPAANHPASPSVQPQASPVSAAGGTPQAQPGTNPIAVGSQDLQPPGQGQVAPAQPSAPTQPVQQAPQEPRTAAFMPPDQSANAPAQPQQAPNQAPGGIQVAGNAPPMDAQPMVGQGQPPQQDNTPPQIKALQAQLNATGRDWGVIQNGIQGPKGQMIPLTPIDQQAILQMSEGNRPPPSRYKQSPHDAMLWAALTQFDPSFTEARFAAKSTFLKGADANTIQAINTAVNHLGVLQAASDALQNGNTPLFNSIANSYSKQLGKPAATNFDTIKGYVAQELRKVYANAQGGSLTELEQIEGNLNKNFSPQQTRGVLRTSSDLLDGRLDSLNTKYQNVMGLAYRPKEWMSSDAHNTYDTLKAYSRDGLPVDRNDNPIPPQALKDVQSNPALAAQFQQAFGRDAHIYVPSIPSIKGPATESQQQ